MANDTAFARPVQLHVIHDLGGGSARWLRDYGAADARRANMILRSFTLDASAGSGVALYRDAFAEEPLRAWTFGRPIAAAAPSHDEYRSVLATILREWNVRAMVVSSVIGHSLDVLDTGLPTVVVLHDYFPYCPAINLYFGRVCTRCDGARIEECHRDNAPASPFSDFPPADRIALRERYMELIARPRVEMAAPSRSVAENLRALDPRFAARPIHVIPHGYGEALRALPGSAPEPGERLRVLVLGQLSTAKGIGLLRAALPELTRFADVFLLGTLELGEEFRAMPHVLVASRFERSELAGHVAAFRPHLGLLASIVPETFSYALTELMMLGVPAAATRLGAFAERIRHRENGYLYEPEPASLLAAMRALDADRALLAAMRDNLRGFQPDAPEGMVDRYHDITPIAAEAPVPASAASPPPEEAGQAHARQTLVLADMWKQVKNLSLQLHLVNESRQREQAQAAQVAAALEQQRERTGTFADRIAELERAVLDRDQRLEQLGAAAQLAEVRLDEVLRSASWRLSAPVRFLGRRLRNLAVVARAVGAIARHPATIPARMQRLRRAWAEGGLHEVKKYLLEVQSSRSAYDVWRAHRRCFVREVRPKLAERAERLAGAGRISIIVPVYDTPPAMLREMLDSVLAQLYPHWELCAVDDASPDPRPGAILAEYAARDSRVKVQRSERNRGAAHASNQALALATGRYVVLLDHDDVLEEHALYRVAESILAERPDMVYSDEVMVAPDGERLRHLALRPAFALEHLRSHPYIVHLVAYRTALVREAGGFDESLRISQDYDLLLRMAEKAHKVVHIPEILYRWRMHESSTGMGKRHEVMETSARVLRRHLERIGVQGSVEETEHFNFFDVRYPIDPAVRVAIVIPTKNHGELLRQCIESIRATVSEVAYDIVVVDHESDEPATHEYLASLAGAVKVLPYAGPFNFSAINNFAIASAGAGYSHYLLCNNDIEAIEPGWLGRMVELGQQRSVGIVGALLFYPDRRTVQHAGVCVGMFGAAEHYGKRMRIPEDLAELGYSELLRINHEVAAVTAACLLIRRDAFEEVGGFDEEIAVGFGDVDLCLRVGQQGYRVLMCPHARLVHHESFTRGTSHVDPHPKDSALFRLKWRKLLQQGDPYYNPAFSLYATHWGVKHPLPCSVEVGRRVVEIDREKDRYRWLP